MTPDSNPYDAIGANEKVLLIFRKHKLYLWVGQMLGWLLILGLMFTALLIPGTLFGITGVRSVAALIIGAMVMLVFLVMLVHWLTWNLTMGVITNEHVIDVDQRGIFGHDSASIPLDKIQDVQVKVEGPLDHFLKIGTVIVQSAGELPNFEFPAVDQPQEKASRILELQEQFLRVVHHRDDPAPPSTPPTTPENPPPPNLQNQ